MNIYYNTRYKIKAVDSKFEFTPICSFSSVENRPEEMARVNKKLMEKHEGEKEFIEHLFTERGASLPAGYEGETATQ